MFRGLCILVFASAAFAFAAVAEGTWPADAPPLEVQGDKDRAYLGPVAFETFGTRQQVLLAFRSILDPGVLTEVTTGSLVDASRSEDGAALAEYFTSVVEASIASSGDGQPVTLPLMAARQVAWGSYRIENLVCSKDGCQLGNETFAPGEIAQLGNGLKLYSEARGELAAFGGTDVLIRPVGQ